MLTVCTTSPEDKWANLGDFLAVISATASSSGMEKALVDATAWAERYILGRQGVLRRQVYLETVAGSGSQRLMLTRTPVLAVTRLFDSTATCEATEYCSTDRRLEDAEAGFLELTSDYGFAWGALWEASLSDYPRPAAVRRSWLVSYEAGWQFACASSTSSDWLTTTTGRTLPEDVERAVLLKAAELYGASSYGMSAMRVGPLAINYQSEGVDQVRDLLGPYRRV